MRELTDQLMAKIAELCGQAYAYRLVPVGV
jgi:hypothetical protein